MKKVKHLVVGAGYSGAIIAERIANEFKEEVLVIDARDHVAGNCYDYKDKNNITIHKYGPHVFHTEFEHVWEYLSRFTKWHPFFYRVKAVIDGIETNIPFNIDSLHTVFPKSLASRLENKLLESFGYNEKVSILDLKKHKDKDLEFLSNYIYEKVFLGYTVKQWGMTPEEIDPSVTARIPVFISRDDRYFQDKYQAIPLEGYTKLISNILNHELITVKTNTSFEDIKDSVEYENLYYTGPIDELFEYKYGELPYRSLNFVFEEHDKEYYQSGPQINYPDNYDYTRSCEYKYYLNEESDKTVTSKEYPEAFERGKNVRYYPIPHDDNRALYNKYLEEAKKLPNTYVFGRLGDYKYYNMDLTVNRALELFDEIKAKREGK